MGFFQIFSLLLTSVALHIVIRLAKNPFENTVLPKVRTKKRELWDADTIRKALDACRDSKLYVAMNLSFACSLRLGETLGLTWNHVHISDSDIAADDAWIDVDKELVRANRRAVSESNGDDIFRISCKRPRRRAPRNKRAGELQTVRGA